MKPYHLEEYYRVSFHAPKGSREIRVPTIQEVAQLTHGVAVPIFIYHHHREKDCELTYLASFPVGHRRQGEFRWEGDQVGELEEAMQCILKTSA